MGMVEQADQPVFGRTVQMRERGIEQWIGDLVVFGFAAAQHRHHVAGGARAPERS